MIYAIRIGDVKISRQFLIHAVKNFVICMFSNNVNYLTIFMKCPQLVMGYIDSSNPFSTIRVIVYELRPWSTYRIFLSVSSKRSYLEKISYILCICLYICITLALQLRFGFWEKTEKLSSWTEKAIKHVTSLTYHFVS